MKTYKLQGKVTISVNTEVEADTLEEAIELAKTLEVVKNECKYDYLKKAFWVNDKYDGEVFEIEGE